MKYQTSQFKNGLKIEIDNIPYNMVYFQFVKPGKGTAFTRTKLKNMLTGAVIERTFRTGETLEAADVETIEMEFLYLEGEDYHFMDMESYEQIHIPRSIIEEESKFLIEGSKVDVLYYKSRPVNIDLPNFVEAEITICDPGVKGNTANGGSKPATISSGATVQVPLFIEQGEWIKVDTRTKEYASRVKK